MNKYINAVIWSHNGKLFASVGLDRRACLWRAADSSYELMHESQSTGGHLMIRTCCFSKDDKLLAFGDYNGSINIFATTAPFEVLYDFETPLGIMNLRFTNDGALICGDHGGNIKCWRFQSVAVQNFFKKAACGNPQKGKIYAKADIKWESG
jgi:WD40 repeat protein